MNLEDDLNQTNQYYLSHDIAVIHKKPTPIQIVKVDYPQRTAAKIVEAYFRTPSTTDYNGLYKGRYIDFEAKETKTKSFPFINISLHQINHLESIIKHGGIAFIIIASVLFGIYHFILKLTGIIQKVIDLSIILTLPSKILGLAVGFIEGYIILFMILLVLHIPFHHNDIFKNSEFSTAIVNNSFLLSSSIGELDDCISDIIELTKESNKDIDKNLKILDLELKYHIISKEDLEQIRKMGKLDKIK